MNKLDIHKTYNEILNVVTKISIENNIAIDSVISEKGRTMHGKISRHIFNIYDVLRDKQRELEKIEAEELLSSSKPLTEEEQELWCMQNDVDDEDFEIMPSDIYCLDATPTADQRTQMLEESEQ